MTTIEINQLHVTAFAALTREWKRLTDLKTKTGLQANAFDDLVTLGFARVRREPVMDGNIQRGERTYFRLTPNMARNKRHILAGDAK